MLKKIPIVLIEFYQKYIRKSTGCNCRFVPSCSEYAKEAISKYGFLKGLFKAARRLVKCHPWSGQAGFDPLK
ncbi:MAG: membrane protein insertion efficiency factor YidD [Candidatus Omnitrophota bacterium]